MPMLSHPSFGPRTALWFVTGGALLSIWTALYYFMMIEGEPNRATNFVLLGLFLSGMVFVMMGLFLGPLGRVARQSELPPVAATRAEAEIQHAAAANAVPPAAVPVAPAVAAAPAAPAPPVQVAPAR